MKTPNVVALAETIREGKLDDLDPTAILHMWAEAILADRDRGKTFVAPSAAEHTPPAQPGASEHTGEKREPDVVGWVDEKTAHTLRHRAGGPLYTRPRIDHRDAPDGAELVFLGTRPPDRAAEIQAEARREVIAEVRRAVDTRLGGINTAKWRHFEIHNILDRLSEGAEQ